jgi:hypothetical protein
MVLYTLVRILIALILFMIVKLVTLIVERIWTSVSRIYSCAGSLSVVTRMLLLRQSIMRARTYQNWKIAQTELDTLEAKSECDPSHYDWQALLELTIRFRALRSRCGPYHVSTLSSSNVDMESKSTKMNPDWNEDIDEYLNNWVSMMSVNGVLPSSSSETRIENGHLDLSSIDKMPLRERQLTCLHELMRLIQVNFFYHVSICSFLFLTPFQFLHSGLRSSQKLWQCGRQPLICRQCCLFRSSSDPNI